MRYIFAVLFLSALPSITFAATALIDNLPPDLAGRMQRSAAGGGAGFALDPPEDFPVFDYPAEVSVLGSIDEAAVSTVVLGETGPDAHARLVQVLQDAGWQYIPDPAPPRTTGFTGAPRRERPPLYCHDVEKGRLSVDQVSNQGERYLLLRLQTGSAFLRGANDQVSCSEQIERNQQRTGLRRDGLGTSMPRLELPGLDDPATAARMHSSSNGGSQNNQHASAQITTTFSLNELSEHFAGKLIEQGWITAGEVDVPYLLTSVWTRQLNDGLLLLGVLSLAETGENSVNVQFTLVRRVAGN